MGLTKRKDGWYVEFRVVDDDKVLSLSPGGAIGRMKRWKTGTTNKTVAKQWEAKLKTDLLMGKISSSYGKVMSFKEWGEQYLKLEEVRSLRSYQDRVEIVRLQLIPYFGSKALNEIKPEHVETYRQQRKLRNGEVPSLQTINNDHTVLKHVLSVAERRGLIEVNVAKKVRMPDPKNERDRVLSEEEWGNLYVKAGTRLKPILLIAYQLGMRLGEILSLTWEQIDLQRGFITLSERDTKTGQARLVPLTASVRHALADLFKVRSLLTNTVFLYNGRSLGSVKKAFKTTLKDAGIESFRFHDLRHWAATNLRRAGVDTVTAMKIIGHKSERMYKRYNNVNDQDLLQASAKLNTLITPVIPSSMKESVTC